ncbi:MAG: hypothetical protein QG604_422 [Candidatus Dependentiae bacterium]|nr:hypothetical protein [Candidatus Dependentiae bacterium]
MNPKHLTILCLRLDLGVVLKSPTRVFGGLVHTMWQVTTDKGRYAVKQLSQRIDLLDNPQVVRNYGLTEQIAFRFGQQGIPVINALVNNREHLIRIDSDGYLVYPWTDAQPLERNLVCERYALKMAELAARMHSINLCVPEIAEPIFIVHSNDRIRDLIQRSTGENCSFAGFIAAHEEVLLILNEQYQKVIPILKQQAVVSHGDMDQKNVLLDSNENVVVIDWECAGKLNPLYEMLDICLNWSGLATNLNSALFMKMVQRYCASGGVIDESMVEPALYGVMGGRLNWFVYNLERSCSDDAEQRVIGVEQVTEVVPMMMRLHKAMPELIESIQKQ